MKIHVTVTLTDDEGKNAVTVTLHNEAQPDEAESVIHAIVIAAGKRAYAGVTEPGKQRSGLFRR
jgi:hypothetical protein